MSTEKGVLDILISLGSISLEEATEARRIAHKKNISLEEELLARGVDENALLKAKGTAMDIPIFSLNNGKVPFDLLRNIPEESARHYKFVPLALDNGVLHIGMIDPDNIQSKEALQFIASRLNRPFKVFLVSRKDFNTILEEYKGISGEVTKVLGELESSTAADAVSFGTDQQSATQEKENVPFVEDAPITKIVAVILRHATEGGASDVHVEPGRDKLRVRFRVDGVLYTSLLLPLNVHEAVVSRIKILTNMQLDERRKPQDGRFSARIDNRQIDFRVSTFPTYFGEKVAIRILDPESGIRKIEDLDLTERNFKAIKEGIARPFGLVLITGPTGSGKSTTLYAMLESLNQERWNVMSLEDPIEYSIMGLNQSQVKPEIGYDFAQGIRHILRQDPDILMVGEIRDKETAQLAIHAALTGHLVLSTLHTNNAVGVIPRLIDMGVDPYLIAPTLIMAIGQRLARTLCQGSREEVPVVGNMKETLQREIHTMPEEIRKKITLPEKIYKPKPSAACPKGTRGRVAIFEVLMMTKELENIILGKFAETTIDDEARRQGMMTMRQDGILKVLDGRIGLEELLEVV